MPVTQQNFLDALRLASSEGENAYGVGYRSQAEAEQQAAKIKAERESEERKPGLAARTTALKLAQYLKTAKDPALQDLLNQGGSFQVDESGIHVGAAPKPTKPALTPAQTAFQTAGGKKLADYLGGGKASAEANISQVEDVKEQLGKGGRDTWDRIVGGNLQNHPTMMGLLAPTEKQRMDTVQNAFLGLAKQAGIQRPTQWEVQRLFGQVYDPSLPTEVLITKLMQGLQKMRGLKQSLDTEAEQFSQTGYIGSVPGEAAPQMPQKPGALKPEEQQELLQLRKELGGK